MNTLSRIKLFYNKQNTQQYITLYSGSITEFLGMVIANLPFWFVPQSIEYSYNVITILPFLELHYILLVIFNFISVIWLCILYIIEIRREKWLIKKLDYSKKYSNIHLTKYKKDYPELFHILDNHNALYYKIYFITKWLLAINIIYSCIVILAFYNIGYKTISALFTNVLLCYNKVRRGLQIGKECISSGIGYSYYNTQHLSYNRIDASIKKHHSDSNINASNGGLSVPNSRLHSRRGSIAGSASLNASWNSNTMNKSFTDNASITNIDNINSITVMNIPNIVISNTSETDDSYSDNITVIDFMENTNTIINDIKL